MLPGPHSILNAPMQLLERKPRWDIKCTRYNRILGIDQSKFEGVSHPALGVRSNAESTSNHVLLSTKLLMEFPVLQSNSYNTRRIEGIETHPLLTLWTTVERFRISPFTSGTSERSFLSATYSFTVMRHCDVRLGVIMLKVRHAQNVRVDTRVLTDESNRISVKYHNNKQRYTKELHLKQTLLILMLSPIAIRKENYLL
jgi:hypothetical protein